jgi:hypothetical protein
MQSSSLPFNTFRTYYSLFNSLSKHNRLEYIKRDVLRCEDHAMNERKKAIQLENHRGRQPACGEADTLSNAWRRHKFTRENMYNTIITARNNKSISDAEHELSIDLLLECMEKHTTSMSKAEVVKV